MENWLCSPGESQHKKLLEDLHLVQFSVFAILEEQQKINMYSVTCSKLSDIAYHRCSSHSLELPVVHL